MMANEIIATIGVLYGYGSREELLEAGAQHVCLSPAEVSAYIL